MLKCFTKEDLVLARLLGTAHAAGVSEFAVFSFRIPKGE